VADRVSIRLTTAEIAATRQGRPYRSPALSEVPDQAEVALLSRVTGELVAMGIKDGARDCVQPKVVLPAES
jgi:hypothetical protein